MRGINQATTLASLTEATKVRAVTTVYKYLYHPVRETFLRRHQLPEKEGAALRQYEYSTFDSARIFERNFIAIRSLSRLCTKFLALTKEKNMAFSESDTAKADRTLKYMHQLCMSPDENSDEAGADGFFRLGLDAETQARLELRLADAVGDVERVRRLLYACNEDEVCSSPRG